MSYVTRIGIEPRIFMTHPIQHTPAGFSALGLTHTLLSALSRANFTTPTPIQEKAIPLAVKGKDIIGIAQTGTGKTLAFGAPMIQRIENSHGGKGLVIVPTRELAIQVEATMQRIGASFGLKTAVLIGGASMYHQKQMIQRAPHIVIATPGRLIDHLNQRSISLARVQVLVLDEADRMLDMGFAPQIKRILQAVPRERQTMLFSATMPLEISKIAAAYMQSPIRVEVAVQGTTAEYVAQEVFVVQKDRKAELLNKLLREHSGIVLVFSRTKYGAAKLSRAIRAMGHSSAEIHSDRSLGQRREALQGFKTGKYRVLVATDIAARGIDVSDIELVVNFDLPQNAEDYVHRIGRTGRAGKKGKAVSFAMPDQKHDVRNIERLIRKTLPIIKV